MTDDQIEEEIQAKGLVSARVTPGDVEGSIASEYYFTGGDGVAANMSTTIDKRTYDYDKLDLITFCVLLLKNGHSIVGANTGPVSQSNFDAELGKKLARQNAVDQIWPLLGFTLRQELFVLSEKLKNTSNEDETSEV